MLTFTNIEQPHIDIELYGTDTYISPTELSKLRPLRRNTTGWLISTRITECFASVS